MQISTRNITHYSSSDNLSGISLQELQSNRNQGQPLTASDKVSLSQSNTLPEVSGAGTIIEPSLIIRNIWDALKAGKNAGEHKELFRQISHSLTDEGELQIEYHKFAAGLSKKDLGNFLKALKSDPDNLTDIMDTASRLSKDALSPYLEAAALAKGNFDEFNEHVNKMLDQERTSSSAFQYTYLSAAVKTGPEIIQFIHAVDNMSDVSLNKLSDFINNEIAGDDRDNFIEFFSFANHDELNTLMDTAKGMNKKNKRNLMVAASWAQNHTDTFIKHISKKQNLTDFLAIAARSEKKLGTFMDLADTLDLKAIGTLSVVDTANFLNAASKPNVRSDELTRIGLQMEGEDKSYLFYAAANSDIDPDVLLSTVEELTGTELSNFLFKTANQKENGQDKAIYMKGLLTKEQYNHFQDTASGLDKGQIVDLVEMTNEFSGQIRSDLLEAGAAADQAAGEFVSMFKTMSGETQKSYLTVAMQLDGELQENFVQASVKTRGNLSEFVQITQELIDYSMEWYGGMAPVHNFLSVAKEANPNDLNGFILLMGQLDEKQKPAFLSTAANSSLGLTELLQLGNSALSLDVDRFVDIFSYSNFNGATSKLSSGDYRNIISLAGQSNDSDWNHFLYASNHFNIPPSQLVSIIENASSFGPAKFDYNFFDNISRSVSTISTAV